MNEDIVYLICNRCGDSKMISRSQTAALIDRKMLVRFYRKNHRQEMGCCGFLYFSKEWRPLISYCQIDEVLDSDICYDRNEKAEDVFFNPFH